jgi:hypothetical protein
MEITITIPEVLASEARSSGLSPETYVERLLERFVAASADQERERERQRKRLPADWEQDRSGGLHLNEDAVDAWFAGLDEGKPKKSPTLHKDR